MSELLSIIRQTPARCCQVSAIYAAGRVLSIRLRLRQRQLLGLLTSTQAPSLPYLHCWFNWRLPAWHLILPVFKGHECVQRLPLPTTRCRRNSVGNKTIMVGMTAVKGDGGHLGLYPRCSICTDLIFRHERVIARTLGHSPIPPFSSRLLNTKSHSQSSETRTRPLIAATPGLSPSLSQAMPAQELMAIRRVAVPTAITAQLRLSSLQFITTASRSSGSELQPQMPCTASGSWPLGEARGAEPSPSIF